MPEYDEGGWLENGHNYVHNSTGHVEHIHLTEEEYAELQAKLDMLTEEVNELKRKTDEDD